MEKKVCKKNTRVCLANMGIKWVPKEHNIGTKFKRKKDDDGHEWAIRI